MVKRKSKITIQVQRPGSLTSLGYHMHDSAGSRHNALKKAVNKYGYAKTMSKINLLYLYNKNRNHSLSDIATADKNWLKKTYPVGSPKRRKSRSPSRRKSRSPSRRKSRSPSRRKSPKRKSRRRRSRR